jgi:hypothetical protein
VIGRPGKGGAAMTLAYFFGLSLFHVPGVLPFLASESSGLLILGTSVGSGLDDREETQIGFEMTILGLAAFVAGAFMARQIDRRCTAAKGAPPHRRARVFGRLGWRAVALGGVDYFVLLRLFGRVPTLTSFFAALATLLVLGLWLLLYDAAVAADWRRTLAILTLVPLLPSATLVAGGFLSFGTYWAVSIVAFLFTISRRRIWFYVAAPPAAFLALSLFVTYMGQRSAIREVAWDGRAGLFERLDQVSSIVTNFELLDLTSPEQADALNGRLNQNAFVGLAVTEHEAGRTDFAYGATVPVWALIPRAVWPNKPLVGGGGNVVSDFTGLLLDLNSSFGAGQVFEFYVNFGIPGVLIGFLGLGYLLMRLDRGITRALAANDMRGLLLRAMPGLMLLQPEANLLEILVGCVAAYLVAHLVIWLRWLDIPSAPRSSRQVV